ncbi:MAG: NifB/NifX family molybdenum-iron cluster-binding protein [Pseudomonadota bacterium]
MKTAFAYWDNRIAPVFDTAVQVHLVETEAGRIIGETQATLPEDLPVQKTLRLLAIGITTLVCGAISKPMRELLVAYGIQVVPFVAGDLREVIRAWLHDNLEQDTFAMPGCRGRWRRGFTPIPHPCEERNAMNRKERAMDAKGGKGPGQEGQRPGRKNGPLAGGPAGDCVCPQCGQRAPHERGIPCIRSNCPKCGAVMARQ